MSKQLQFMAIAAFAAAVFAGNSREVQAQTFVTLKDSDCLTNVSGLFTTGGQYVDPNNGVLNNSWSMLARWQGNNFVSNAVSYPVGNYTGFYPPAPASTWQRGVQPENATNGTPAVQINCHNGGMLINTWWTPHAPVLGGGYNDMFGYQWSAGLEPRPFFTYVAGQARATDLIVQSNIAVTLFGPYTPAGTGAQRAHGQVSLFAYLIDTTHPNLHPIAIVMQTHDDLSATNAGFVSCDYANGVWFASGDAQSGGLYSTADPFSTPSQKIVTVHNTALPSQFYRMRISNQNMVNIANAINASTILCPAAGGGFGAPAKGYSTNPWDYVLKYGGIIAEAMITGDATTSVLNDPSIAQVSLGVKFDGVSMYRRY